MKKHLTLSISLIAILTGCGVNQPKIPNINQYKNSDGYKSYLYDTIIKDNKYLVSIVAEKPKEYIVDYRTNDENVETRFSEDVYDILDNARTYCKNVGGNFIYGKQAKEILENFSPNPLNPFPYISTLNEIKKQERNQGLYEKFAKCEANNGEGFTINMLPNVSQAGRITFMKDTLISYSRYYIIKQDKPQKLGYVGSVIFKHKTPIEIFSVKSGKLETKRETHREKKDYFSKMYLYKLCVSHNGTAYITNKFTSNGKMNVNDYIFARTKYFANKYPDPNPSIFRSYPIFADNNEYLWCESPNKMYNLTLETKNEEVYLKQGVDKKLKNMPFGTYKIPNNDNKVKENHPSENIPSVVKGLAKYTLNTQSNIIKSVGQDNYQTSYNGIEPDGCYYASVIKSNPLSVKRIYNFKKCDNSIKYIGLTGVEGLTDEAKTQFKQNMNNFENNCKIKNYARMEANEFVMKCLKNPSSNNYEFIIMKDGKLINKTVQRR